jgi:hypothetical protein
VVDVAETRGGDRHVLHLVALDDGDADAEKRVRAGEVRRAVYRVQQPGSAGWRDLPAPLLREDRVVGVMFIYL